MESNEYHDAWLDGAEAAKPDQVQEVKAEMRAEIDAEYAQAHADLDADKKGAAA
jgi:hypothetical protein